MIINGNDKFIGRSIEQFGSWAADDIELIKSILQIQLQTLEKISFYDVGANIGTHTVALAKHFGSQIQVRSFEAQRQIYYLLCGNVALNGLDNVICEHLAVSNQSGGTIPIELPDYSKQNNFGGLELVVPCRSDNSDMIKKDFEHVQVTTLDFYEETVDFIKLDVEGMEHLVLTGAEQTFDRHRPVCFFEVLKTDVDLVKSFFAQRQYQIHQLRPDDWIAIPAESDVELDLPVVLI